MTHTKKSYCLVLAIFALAALGGRVAAAQTPVLVFNSFSTTAAGGDCIAGSKNTGCFSAPTSEWIATPFSPKDAGELAYLEVGADWMNGTNGVVVTLVNDDDGSPGPLTSALESFTAALPKSGAKPNPRVKLTSKLHPSLSAGTTYWVVMAPHVQNSLSSWNLSSADTNAPDISTDEGVIWSSFDTIFGGPLPPYTNLPELAVYEE